MCVNRLAGALVGVGGSDFIGYSPSSLRLLRAAEKIRGEFNRKLVALLQKSRKTSGNLGSSRENVI